MSPRRSVAMRHVWFLSMGVLSGGHGAKELPFSGVELDASVLPVTGTNALRELQGKVPGALNVQPSGRPGRRAGHRAARAKIARRWRQTAGPLIILGGTILNPGTQDINADDVESIEVIKGAAASTLYGSHAGAGVIQIITKTPQRAPPGPHLTVPSEYGVDDVAREYAYARRQFLLMNERNERFCIKVAGQPSCSRTVDFAEEARRRRDAVSARLPPRLIDRRIMNVLECCRSLRRSKA